MKTLICCAFAATALMPAVAHAASSVDVSLTAHVDPFCRISVPDNGIINVENGSAMIGQVNEICNTPDGYDVLTHFTNLTAGQLTVGGNDYALRDGFALRSSTVPAVRSMTWSLNDAQLASNDAPVIMQVVITPRG